MLDSSLVGWLDCSFLVLMAASSGSLETTTGNFSFMSTSFTDLLVSDDYPLSISASTGNKGLGDRIAERTGSGVPKFKSLPPPSLPISPPAISPSSYFAIPPGLSPTELLDSPVLLSASSVSISLSIMILFSKNSTFFSILGFYLECGSWS